MRPHNISLADKTDVPALEQLVNSAFRGDSSRKGWTTEADLLDGIRIDQDSLNEMIDAPGSVILKYYEDHVLAGCVYLQKKESFMYLGMLTVSPEMQNKGIGKKLMTAAESYALSLECDTITMTVLNERDELTDWYKRQGFYFTGELKGFPAQSKFGIPKKDLFFKVMNKKIKKDSL